MLTMCVHVGVFFTLLGTTPAGRFTGLSHRPENVFVRRGLPRQKRCHGLSNRSAGQVGADAMAQLIEHVFALSQACVGARVAALGALGELRNHLAKVVLSTLRMGMSVENLSQMMHGESFQRYDFHQPHGCRRLTQRGNRRGCATPVSDF